MTAVEGAPAPLPSIARGATESRSGDDPRPSPLPSLCPFLATPDGNWRSANAIREHRCMAVSPPVPLAPEKQRRLCLVDAHVGCATYGAAMAARSDPHERPSGHSRPVARTTPVILDQRRIDLRIQALRTDRASQGILVGVLGVAFAAILLARPADPGASPAGAGASPPPTSASSTNAADAPPTEPPATPTDAPEPSQDPAATASPVASTEPGAEASPRASANSQPTTSGETYRVKSGDTLIAIASRLGTTTQVLIRLNGIEDPSRLKIGQILKLP